MRRADRALTIVGAHAPPAVDEQQHALIALVLELAHNRLAEPQRRSPVDMPDRIAGAVVGELFEVRAFAALLVGLDADFLQAAVAGQPRVARELGEVGIDARVSVGTDPLEELQKPQRDRTRMSAGENVTSPRRVGVAPYVVSRLCRPGSTMSATGSCTSRRLASA